MSYKPGEMLKVTITESTPHPGWYRVILAKNSRSELPPDPTVTPGNTACGTVTGNKITGLVPQDPPVFPVLADGALFHTAAFTGPQSFMVKLPTDVTCTNCILEVEEFMSDHGLNGAAGCFYHHCAAITIAGTPVIDAGATSDASDAGPGGSSGTAGTTGTAGITGTAGTTGTAGVTGTAGTTGTAGITGTAGMTGGGAAGTTGAAGTNGGAGTTGGTAGSTGTPRQSSGGCTVSATPSSRSATWIGLVLVGICVALKRRRIR
jgi:hypothetical protein